MSYRSGMDYAAPILNMYALTAPGLAAQWNRA